MFPVLETEEGSNAQRHIATAFAVSSGERAAFVTAAHAVDSSHKKTLIIPGSGKQLTWPSRHGALVPRHDGIGQADIAFLTGTITDSPDSWQPISLSRLVTNLDLRPDMSFVALGYPVSR